MLYAGWLNWELVFLNVKVLSSLAPRRFLPFKMILKIWSYTEGRLYAIETFHYSKCSLPWLRELKYLTNDKLKPAKITYTQCDWCIFLISFDYQCRCGVQFCHQCGGPFHFGPCKHKCCGNVLCNIFIFMMLLAFCYFVYFEVHSVPSRKG